MTEENKNVSGIGGWLILILLGLIVTPIRVGYTLFSTFDPIFTNGTWEALTTEGSQAYHELWAPLLIFEAAGNIGIIVLALVTLYHLVKKSKRTPWLAIAWLSWIVVFVVIDFFVADMIPAVAAQDNPDSERELVRSLISAAIWIPYFLVSKRVKATFVY